MILEQKIEKSLISYLLLLRALHICIVNSMKVQGRWGTSRPICFWLIFQHNITSIKLQFFQAITKQIEQEIFLPIKSLHPNAHAVGHTRMRM